MLMCVYLLGNQEQRELEALNSKRDMVSPTNYLTLVLLYVFLMKPMVQTREILDTQTVKHRPS